MSSYNLLWPIHCFEQRDRPVESLETTVVAGRNEDIRRDMWIFINSVYLVLLIDDNCLVGLTFDAFCFPVNFFGRLVVSPCLPHDQIVLHLLVYTFDCWTLSYVMT